MLFRIAFICLLSAAFGFGFAEIVEHADTNVTGNAANPCSEWSNPQCASPAIQ
jgi:hypothetical protein